MEILDQLITQTVDEATLCFQFSVYPIPLWEPSSLVGVERVS